MRPNQWRRSRLGQYLRHLPRPKHIRGTWLHRRLGDKLLAPELWQPSRRRFAAGAAVGAFFALMPAPFQMLAAALIAYITRVNVPIAIAATWITNPFTFPFFIYIQYRIGCLLLGRNATNVPTHDLVETLKHAPLPLVIGVLPSAMIAAAIVYPVTLMLWDLIQSRLHPKPKN